MNQKDFLEIVLPFKDKMYRFAKRLLVSSEEAEDAVQEIYLKLWKGRESIGKYRNPEAFAMTMTKNYCLDRLKSGQASNLKIVHSNYQHSDNVQRKVEARDEVSILFRIMDTLPEQQRMILQLRDVEQYEFEEIAEMLDLRENTIRVNLSRARKTVREQMLKQYNYGINQN
jgi:RNA polymerase sigma-70 factor (ECF subfamily)